MLAIWFLVLAVVWNIFSNFVFEIISPTTVSHFLLLTCFVLFFTWIHLDLDSDRLRIYSWIWILFACGLSISLLWSCLKPGPSVDFELRLRNTSCCDYHINLSPSITMAAKEDDVMSIASNTSTATAKKVCDSCHKRIICSQDSHVRCLGCYGPTHDMIKCHCCQDLPYPLKLLYARRIAQWGHLGTEGCPTSTSIKRLCSGENIPLHLQLSNVTPMFEVVDPDPLPSEDEDDVSRESIDEEVEDQDEDFGDTLLEATSPVKKMTFTIPKISKKPTASAAAGSSTQNTAESQSGSISDFQMWFDKINEQAKKREKELLHEVRNLVSQTKQTSNSTMVTKENPFVQQSVHSDTQSVSEVQYGLLGSDRSETDDDSEVIHEDQETIKLSPGVSNFDWDIGGEKEVVQFSPGTPQQKIIDLVDSASNQLGNYIGLPTTEGTDESSKVSMGLFESPSIHVQSQSLFVIPDRLKSVWDTSRKNTSVIRGPLVPSVVRKCYKLTPEEWSYLGPVRRPDFILQNSCYTVKNKAGVHNLKDYNANKVCSIYDKVAHTATHLFRTDCVTAQASETALGILKQLSKLMSKNTDPQIKSMFEELTNCVRLGGTAAQHNADGLARLNAFCIRGLRSEWLAKSSLQSDIKEKVSKAPVCEGNVSSSESVQFVAPIVGSILKSELDQQYEIKKKTDALKKKTDSFKRPANQSRRGGDNLPKSRRLLTIILETNKVLQSLNRSHSSP